MKNKWLKRGDKETYANTNILPNYEGDMNQEILFTGGDILQTLETNPQNNQSIRIEQSNEDESVGKHIRIPTSPSDAIVRGVSTQNFFKSNKDIFGSKKFFNIPGNSVHPLSGKQATSQLPFTATSTGRQSTMPNSQVNRKSKKAISMMPEFSFWAVVQIRKMMERLKTRYAYANLKALHYSLIDDASVDSRKKDPTKDTRRKYGEEPHYIKQFIRTWFKKLTCSHYSSRKRYFAFLGAQAERIPVFIPSNTFKLIWDFVKGLSLLVMFFCIPLHVAVSESIIAIIGKTLMSLSISVIFSDLLVSLNTGYFSKGQIVTNRHLIVTNYISNQLLSDIIAFAPLIIVVSDYEDQTFAKSIFTLLFFVKVSDFSRVLKKIEDSFLLRPTTTNIVALLKLLFVILFVAHLSACVWIFEGRNSQETDTWYSNDKINSIIWDPEWLDWYIKAYYFCTVTMVTVGYGDIFPASNQERVLSVGTMLLACCMYAYIVNSIGNIFSDFFRHSKEVKDNFYAINNYMEKKNISSQLKLKIKEYLSYYWDEERDNLAEKEQNIIKQLSESLKRELKIEANKIVLSDSPIFHQNFSKVLNEKICGIIQEHRCFPEQIVMKENEEDDCNIYFIQKGKVEVFLTKVSPEGVVSTKSCLVLEKGQYFGAYSFFTGLSRQQSVRSMEFSQFLVIKRKDFIDTIRSFEDDYQKFCMIKDQLMFKVTEGTVENACFTCKANDHIFTQCPITHYAPKRSQIIKKYHFSSTHHRRTHTVRTQQKFQTLRELEDTIKEGIKYIELNESYLLDQDWLDSYEDERSSENESGSSNSDDQNKVESIANNLSQASSKQNYPKSKLKKYGSYSRKSPSQSPDRNRNTANDYAESSDFLKEDVPKKPLKLITQNSRKRSPEPRNLLEATSSSNEQEDHLKQVKSENTLLNLHIEEKVKLSHNNFFPPPPEIKENRKQPSINQLQGVGATQPSQKNLFHQQLISIQDIQENQQKTGATTGQPRYLSSKGLLQNIEESKRPLYFEGIEIKETISQTGDAFSVDPDRAQPVIKGSSRSIELIPFFTMNNLESDQPLNKSMSSLGFSNLNEISLAQWNPLERESKKDKENSNEGNEFKRNDFNLDVQSPCFAESYRNSSHKPNKGGIIVDPDLQQIESVRGFLLKDSQDIISSRLESTRLPIIQGLIIEPMNIKQLNSFSNNEKSNNPPLLARQETGYLGGADQKAERSSMARKPRTQGRHLSLAVSNRSHTKQVSIEDPPPFQRKQKHQNTLIINSSPKTKKPREKAMTPTSVPSKKQLNSNLTLNSDQQQQQKQQQENFTTMNFDLSQPADIDKTSKKERFWKNLQKNGQKISSGGLCSPLIERARVRLGEITPIDQNSQHTGSHSRHTSRSTNLQDIVPEIGIQAIAYTNFSRPVSPNSRGKRNMKSNFPVSPSMNGITRTEPRRQPVHRDSASLAFFGTPLDICSNANLNNKSVSFDQLKGMFNAIMNRIEENSRPPFSANSITPIPNQQKLNRLSSMYPEPQGSALEIEGHHGFNLLGNSMGIARTNLPTPSSHHHHHHSTGYFFAHEDQRLQHMNSLNKDFIPHSDFTQQHLDVLLDVCYNFNTFYPEHNISHVMNLLNKTAFDQLKVMKKIKIKKTKANLLNTISEAVNAGNFGEKFKRKLINAKFLRTGNPRIKLNPINIPSEDEGQSEKSPSSSFNSKFLQSSTQKVNYSSAIRRALQQNKITPGISQISGHSISSNSNNILIHQSQQSQSQKQQSQLPQQTTIFSKFKN